MAKYLVFLPNKGVMILRMDKFGRVLIPKTARKSLKLEAGSKIDLTID